MQESFTGDECTGLADLLSKTSIDAPDNDQTPDQHRGQTGNNSSLFSPSSAAREGRGAASGEGRARVAGLAARDYGGHDPVSGADMSFSFGDDTPSTPFNGNGGNRNDGMFNDWEPGESATGGIGGHGRGGLDFSTPATSANGPRRHAAGPRGATGGAAVEDDSDIMLAGASFDSAGSSMHR